MDESRTRRFVGRLAVGLLVVALAACGKRAEPEKTPNPSPPTSVNEPTPAPASTVPPAPAPTAPPRPAVPETLESVSKAFAEARANRDQPRLVAMTKSILPSIDDLRRILRSSPETEAFLARYDAEGMRRRAVRLSMDVLRPKHGESIVKVYSATTEELIAYEKGTDAFERFPGGMHKFAEAVAAPGRTWQIIEFLAPGEKEGTRYVCFTVLDGRLIAVP